MVKRGEWADFDPLGYLATDIHHKTLGIVGMGSIGSEMAKRAAGELDSIFGTICA